MISSSAVRWGVLPLLLLWPAAGLNEAPSGPPRHSFDLERFSAEDLTLARLISESKLQEVRELVGSLEASGSDSCATHSLLVDAALQGGWLAELERESLVRGPAPPPKRLYRLAAVLAEMGEEVRALNLFSHQIQSRSPCLGSYRGYVHLSARRGRLPEAISILSHLVRQDPANPHALVALGAAWEALGEGRLARSAFQQALLTAPRTPSAAYYLANLLSRQGRFESAVELSDLGEGLARSSGNLDLELRLLRIGSFAALMLQRGLEWKDRFDRALQLADSSRVGPWIADTLLDGAELAGSAGDDPLFQELMRRVRRIDVSAWSPRERSAFRLRFGSILLGTGDVAQAGAHLGQALEEAVRSQDPLLEADVRLQRVHLWTMMGEPTRALEEGARVLRSVVELQLGDRQARALAALGSVYDRVGRHRDALESYRQALRFEERTGNRHQQSLALANLALVYLRMGLPGPAVVHASQADELAKAFPDVRLQASVKQALAAALAGGGDYRQSEALYGQALELAREHSSLALRGLVLAGRGRILLALGRLAEAESHFSEALDLAKRNDDPLLRLQAQSGLALAEWQRGDLALALGHLDECRRLVEGSRRILQSESDRMSYSETRSQIYANLAAILIELDAQQPGGTRFTRSAFEAVEQSRARSLLDILDPAGGSGADPGAAVADFPEIQGSGLRADELLLLFALGERRSTLWLVSASGLSWYELPPRSALEAEVHPFLDAIRVPPRAPGNPFPRHRASAQRLYEILLGPADAEVRRARRLIISPDAILYRLPFEALMTRDENGKERYLVETHAVSYTPSASVMVNLRRRPRSAGAQPKFLGIAQPGGLRTNGGGDSWIPHAAEEVERVGRLFPPELRSLIVGEAADESAIKSASTADFRILHIAAHGLADERSPLRSALFLGSGKSREEDGILRMSEVLDLSFDCDLVVLSACETGRGRLLRSEGALGFSWAFLSAGASTVAVSLWNVNDRATSELMVAFYEEAVRGSTLAEAMARAKRTMLGSSRRAHRHPYFWAPFVLMGTGDAIPEYGRP